MELQFKLLISFRLRKYINYLLHLLIIQIITSCFSKLFRLSSVWIYFDEYSNVGITAVCKRATEKHIFPELHILFFLLFIGISYSIGLMNQLECYLHIYISLVGETYMNPRQQAGQSVSDHVILSIKQWNKPFFLSYKNL